MYTSNFKNASLVTVLLLVASWFVITPTVANAAPNGPVNCSASGSFTITNDVVVSSANCVGSATIPTGVTVANNAFASSPGLTEIVFSGTILGSPWSASATVRVTGFVDCGTTGFFYVLQNAVASQQDCTGSVVIPEGVTTVDEAAFDADMYWGGVGQYGGYNGASTTPTSITSLVLPSTLTFIGNYAFRILQSPTLVIPDSVTHIGNYAFVGSAITSLTIGDGLTTIGVESFSQLHYLTSLTIGSGVRVIATQAFWLSSSLAEVTIPDYVESIGNDAFTGVATPFTLNYCGNADLTNTGLPNPASNAASCSPAIPVNVSAVAGSGSAVISFTPGAEGGSAITSYEYSLDGAGFTSFSSPSTASPLTISGLVNGSSYTVSFRAISAQGPGTVVTLSSIVAGIAAYSDPAIVGLTAPDAGAIPDVTITPTSGYTATVTWAGSPATFELASFYVATIQLTATAGHTVVGVPANTFTIAGATSVTHATSSSLITAVFVTAGDGEIDCGGGGEYLISSYVVTGANNCLGSVVIPNGITEIGYQAFQYSEIQGISFQAGGRLVSIGAAAFDEATQLEAIVIPSSVSSIGAAAFQGARSLRSVTFSAGIQLTIIPTEAFAGASSLSNISIPNSVTTMRASAFRDAVSLRSVTFGPGSNIRSIGSDAFNGASSLETMHFPRSLETIEYYAFRDATSLRSVTFEDGSELEELGGYAFYGATSLSEIQVPGYDLDSGRFIFVGADPSLFSRSFLDWKRPVSAPASSPKVGETVYASAFEKPLSISVSGANLEEYVYRITKEANVAPSSVDLQSEAPYHVLTAAEQNQWYEDLGFDPASAPASNPYQFSWRAFVCVAEVNATVALSKPGGLSLSYASRDEYPAGTSSESHVLAFRDATEQLYFSTSPSTRTVVGLYYNRLNTSIPTGADMTNVDPTTSPFSYGISQVDGSCASGSSLEALEILEAGTSTSITTKHFTISPELSLKRGSDYLSFSSGGVTIGVTGGYASVPGFNAALWGLTTIAGPAVISPQQSSYAGPIANTFFPRLLEVNTAQTVRVFGQNLDQVKSMSYKNINLSFTIISSREIEVRIPALSIGIKEIKFDAGTGGIVTHLNALEVRDTSFSQSPAPEVPVTTQPVRKSTIWGFVAGLARLDSNGTKNLNSITKRLVKAKEITCVGFTMGPTATARDIQLSYNRASVICKRLAASIPGVKVIRIEGRQETKVGDRVRRVEIWWR